MARDMTPYYERAGVTIYCGDCLEVSKKVITDNTINLTVTSPPYDLVDENMVTHCDKGLRDYQGYEWDFVGVANELWRVTAKGGVVVWVVGDATVNGSETGTSFRQALYFKGVGFRLHDTMIYGKRNYMPRTHNRYEQSFEYMFVLSKGTPVTWNPILEKSGKIKGGSRWRLPNGETKPPHSARGIKDKKVKGNIFSYSVGEGVKGHVAPFPEALARDHIISWSNPNDLILDPFMGSGTTLKMAQQLGRRAVGIEISEEYCKIAAERLRQPSFFSIPTQPQKEKPKQAELFDA